MDYQLIEKGNKMKNRIKIYAILFFLPFIHGMDCSFASTELIISSIFMQDINSTTKSFRLPYIEDERFNDFILRVTRELDCSAEKILYSITAPN